MTKRQLLLVALVFFVGCGSTDDGPPPNREIQPGGPESGESLSPWKEQRSEICEMPVTPPEEYQDWSFSIPNDATKPIPTIDDVFVPRRDPDEHSVSRNFLLRASPQMAGPWETNLNMVPPGQDVTLHLVFGTNDISDWFRHEVGVVVDYEPVEFQYTRLNRDRSAVLARGKSSWIFDKTQEKSWFAYDITIPAEAFEAGRYHEVGVYARASDDYLPGRGSVSYQRGIFYGGAEFPEPPAPVCHFEEDHTRIEESELNKSRPNLLTLVGDEWDEPLPTEPISVEGGQTVRLKLTLGWHGHVFREDGQRRRAVMIPLMNSEPFRDRIWFQVAWKEDVDGPVAYRQYIDLKIPEEPGVYVVRAAGWTWLYEPRFAPTGQELRDGLRRPRGDVSTNYLEFHVSE